MATSTESPQLRDAIQQAMSKAPRCDEASLAALRSHSLLSIVKGMEPELTSKEPKTAPLALQVLAYAAIERDGAASELPTTDALAVLFAFLVTKINHFTTIDSAVDAVSRVFVWYSEHHPSLLTSKVSAASSNNSPPIIQSVIKNMLSKISVPSMFGNSKASAFALLKSLLRPAIVGSFTKEDTNSFLEAFLVSVDGERDPTYVLDVFTMSFTILTSFSATTLANYAEDYFVTVSNYFPVLFNPPPKCTVTKEELKAALTRVLVLPVFHEVCIPFILSKLSSPAEIAKIDSLAVLREILGSSAAEHGGAAAYPNNKRGGEGGEEEGVCAYSPSLLEPHMADVLGSLRGEALKLASSIAFNNGAKDLLRLVMSATEDVGRVLDLIGGGASSSTAGPSSALSSSQEGVKAAPSVSPAGRDAILSACDRTLTAILGTIDAGSDARAYAMLVSSLGRGGDVVVSVLASYLLPMIGIKLLGLGAEGEGEGEAGAAMSNRNERIFAAAASVIGGLFSAIEVRKNGGGSEAAHRHGVAIAIKPQTTHCIMQAFLGCVGSVAAKHPLEDLLPLLVEVVSTFIAIRDVLPGGEEAAAVKSGSGVDETDDAAKLTYEASSPFASPSSVSILRTLLRRACASHTESDASAVTMRAIANVARVAEATVVAAALGSLGPAEGSVCYELAASPRLPSFFIALHAAVGAKSAAVRAAALDVLLLGAADGKGKKAVLPAAIDVFGYSDANGVIDGYLRALALFCASEAAAQHSLTDLSTEASTSTTDADSGAVPRVIAELLRLAVPEQSAAGADLLCELLSRCPASQAGLLSEADPSGSGVLTSWLCAVASASEEAVAVHYKPALWAPLCLATVSNGRTSSVRALALRAVASIASKGDPSIVTAASFEEAMLCNAEPKPTATGPNAAPSLSLGEGDKAAVRAAVCKGVLARGVSDVGGTLAPLVAAVWAAGSAPVPLAVAGGTSNSTVPSALLLDAFGQLVSPPFPTAGAGGSGNLLWLQRAYCTLLDTFLGPAPATTSGGHPTPLSIMCVSRLVEKAPVRTVSATADQLVKALVRVLEQGNSLVGGKSSAVTSSPSSLSAAVSTPSEAAFFTLLKVLAKADVMPVEAVREAATAFLTYGAVAKAVYRLAYGPMASSSAAVTAAAPLAVRELFVSALLAVFAVVEVGLDGGNASSGKVTNKVDPLKGFAVEAKQKWVLAWLRMAVDDPKRPVRTIAAKASHEWYRLK